MTTSRERARAWLSTGMGRIRDYEAPKDVDSLTAEFEKVRAEAIAAAEKVLDDRITALYLNPGPKLASSTIQWLQSDRDAIRALADTKGDT
jgi:hypothetical protein